VPHSAFEGAVSELRSSYSFTLRFDFQSLYNTLKNTIFYYKQPFVQWKDSMDIKPMAIKILKSLHDMGFNAS